MALLSKIGPSGVSSTGTYTPKDDFSIQNVSNLLSHLQIKVKPTFPMGFILRKSGVLLDTPISKFFTSSTLTPLYSAAISALKPFLLVFPACST